MYAGRSEGGEAARDAGPYEGEDWRGALALVQPDEQPPVREHSIGVREGVGRGGLAEADSLVELDRAAHVADRDAELVERPRERQRPERHQTDAPCAVPGRCSRSPSVQP